MLFHTLDILFGCNGFKPVKHIRQRQPCRGKPLWLPHIRAGTEARPYNDYDAVDVIGHDDMTIQFNMRIMVW